MAIVKRTPQIIKTTLLRRAAAAACAADGITYQSTKIYDYDRIATLLSEGHTIRAVAEKVGCSAWPVQCVKKRLKENGFG